MSRRDYERIKEMNAIRAGWREAFGRSYEADHDGNPPCIDVEQISEDQLRRHYLATNGGETPPRGCSKARWNMYRKLRADPERYALGANV